MANWVLFQWGPIQFQVFPFNVNQYSHVTGSDWAKKEIAGAAMYREWVGEADEHITLKGRIFPHFFARAQRNRKIGETAKNSSKAGMDADKLLQEASGQLPSAGGLMHLDVIDNMRRMGQSHILIRGDGWCYGWFIIETLQRSHTMLAKDGIGQMIEFDASFQRVPVPNDGAENAAQMYSSGGIVETPPQQAPAETIPAAPETVGA